MNRCTALRGAGLFAAAALVLGSSPAVAAPAADEDPTIGESVAQALFDAAPDIAVISDANCMSAPAEPLVYRSDRVVLRTGLGKTAIKTTVNLALDSIGSPNAVATSVEIIKLPQTPGARTDAALKPVASVTLDDKGEPIDIVELSRTLTDSEESIPSAPDYILSPSSGPDGVWPYGDPVPTTKEESPRKAAYGEGVEIWALDTGLPDKSVGAWAPNVSRLTSNDKEILDAVDPTLDIVDTYFKGHTLAIADVINTMAPGADVEAVMITDEYGLITDVSAARRIAAELKATTDWPQIMVAAFGSAVCEQEPGVDMVPVGLDAIADAVDKRGGAVMVISAGNRSSSRAFYPAAFETDTNPLFDAVIGVGALDTAAAQDGDTWFSTSRSAPRADFSNYGDWVDGWTSGVDFPVRHVKHFKFSADGDYIEGRAIVSGTSFAAPALAAQIAEVISTAPDDDPIGPKAAWSKIKDTGVECDAETGGVAVALTSMSATATTEPVQGTVAEC